MEGNGNMTEYTGESCCVCEKPITFAEGGFLLHRGDELKPACQKCYEKETYVPGKPCCVCGKECWGQNILGEPLCDSCADVLY